ncbi:MAG: YifB family Mg chelatase-like AAA ATPase [Patescibacteria group bacterium]
MKKAYAIQAVGLKGTVVTVEVDLFRGFHTFSIVGLPDKAVEESRDRVSSAIKSTGFPSPKSRGQEKVVISLAPADLKKEGPLFDLAIAVGYLLAADEIRCNTDGKIFLGELSLGGELRPIRGALLLARAARDAGFQEIYLPKENAREAALLPGIGVFGARTLKDIVSHINEKTLDAETRRKTGITEEKISLQEQTPLEQSLDADALDFSFIKGQAGAKRGLEIAAAGGHNIAFYGPPGTGKTLLAKALAGILPPLSFEEALEVTSIHSLAGKLERDLITVPPFRAPHHTSSHIAVVGGGTVPKPGEITLAHRGVLFLDEFPEFDKRVVESLREPLESGVIHISRARGSEVFPARCILVAALNPCPCGFYGDTIKECVCGPSQLLKYQRKLSGPIMDRIDMWVSVPRIAHEKLSEKGGASGESASVRQRVATAREAQTRRFGGHSLLRTNADIGVKDIERYIELSDAVHGILNESAKKLDLSARAYHRVMKLARTIADLEGSLDIAEAHMLEALQYRPK